MLMGKNGGMSNIFGAPKAGGPNGVDESRAVPTGDTVGSYTSYLDAQKAVDYLADQQFPVQMVSIVGNELKMVERVTGRLSYPRVALSGALSGMWFGLFVGVMLSFFAPSPGYFSILTSVLMGAAFFMLFGIVTYAMQRGKRDFTSTSQVVATNYDVVVSPEAAHEARRLLQQLPMTRSDAAAGQRPYAHGDNNPPYQQPGQQPGQAPVRPATLERPLWPAGRGPSKAHRRRSSPASRRTLRLPSRRRSPRSATRTCLTAGPSTASGSATIPHRQPAAPQPETNTRPATKPQASSRLQLTSTAGMSSSRKAAATPVKRTDTWPHGPGVRLL